MMAKTAFDVPDSLRFSIVQKRVIGHVSFTILPFLMFDRLCGKWSIERVSNDDFRKALAFLTWAPRIWPLLLTMVFFAGARIAGRRIAFIVLGALLCYGSLWIAQTFTAQWRYDVSKSLSASDQTAIIWIKAGIAAQLISFFLAMPFVYWLRREFVKVSRQETLSGRG